MSNGSRPLTVAREQAACTIGTSHPRRTHDKQQLKTGGDRHACARIPCAMTCRSPTW